MTKKKEQLRGAKRWTKKTTKGSQKRGDLYTPEEYDKKDGHRLRFLKQCSYDELMAKKPKQLHSYLVQSGLLPDYRKFKCDKHCVKLAWKGPKGRCTKSGCTFTCTRSCFTPLHKTKVSEKQYASLAFSYSSGLGADQARLFAACQ